MGSRFLGRLRPARRSIGASARAPRSRGLRHPTNARLWRPGLVRSLAGFLAALLVASAVVGYFVVVGGDASLAAGVLLLVVLAATAGTAATLSLRVVCLVRGARLIRAGRRALSLAGLDRDQVAEGAAAARMRALLAPRLSWAYRHDRRSATRDGTGRGDTAVLAAGLAAGAAAGGAIGI